MPHNQSALPILLQEILDDPGLAHEEVFRCLFKVDLQDRINTEAAARIGAGRYERTSQRITRPGGAREPRGGRVSP